MIEDLSVMIAGKAGDGVLFTGNVLARLLKRHGWEVSTHRDFPSNIRGESTSYTIRASLGRRYGLGDEVDVLLAFDCEAVLSHFPRIARGGIVFCDGEGAAKLPPEQTAGRTFHRLPLGSLARERFGQVIYQNMLALGALTYVLSLDCDILEEIISEMFLSRKGQEVVRRNVEAAAFGYDRAREIVDGKDRHALAKKPDEGRLLLSGDEAVALGALAAGCRFFASYPICPASEIGQWLARHLPQANGVVVQTEDEVAALNMALGASFAGARAMTATSGPGASLMMEAFSLAGMTELPVVVAHVQRVGPATGIPTKTEQSDVLQWIFGSHGDFPRIILAPGTVGECFELTVRAFNLADKCQCPVIVLTELEMGQNLWTTDDFDFQAVRIDRGKLLRREDLAGRTDFRRYELTADGISPRSLPGFPNGIHLVESLEHDEWGNRSEERETRLRMMEKRMRKLAAAGPDLPPCRAWGDRKAEVGLVGFGATLSPALEALKRLEEKKIPAKLLQLRALWPFPAAEVKSFLEECAEVFVVENNYSGQLATLLQSQVAPSRELRNIISYASRALLPSEIVRGVEEGRR